VKRILIVDDDSSVLEMLSRALSTSYDIAAARDGVEALAMAAERPLDLLITDYLMPAMTGDELILRLRAVRPDAKVLMITGHGDLLDREAPSWWSSVSHLGKPFRIRTLRDTVAELLA
jgi:CheY-like chemotaxis protein